MCLYRVFSVYCTGYTLVDDCGRNIEGRTKGSGTKRGMGQELKWKKNDQEQRGMGLVKYK